MPGRRAAGLGHRREQRRRVFVDDRVRVGGEEAAVVHIDRVGAGWSDAYVFFKHEAESTRRALALRNLILTNG